MSGFVQALDSYRNGTLTRDELLAEIERQLTAGEADSGALLAALNNEQARERLPGNIHIEIVRKLLRRRESPAAEPTARRPPQRNYPHRDRRKAAASPREPGRRAPRAAAAAACCIAARG